MRHPAARLLSFLLFTLLLARADAAVLGVAAVLIVIAHMWARVPAHAALRLISRARWLFLSIVVLYLWFTPGRWVWPGLQDFSPTWAGVALGSHRVLALALMIATAQLLLACTPRDQLLAGLCWLLAPLRGLGFPVTHFAVRTVLAAEYVAVLQSARKPTRAHGARRSAWVERLAAAYSDALARAARTPPAEIVLPTPMRPGALDLLAPFALGLGLVFL